MLDLTALAYLHRGTRHLADVADEQLLPTVCGYRRGAAAGTAYRTEVRRFGEISNGLASEYGYVVVADVYRFFEHVDASILGDVLGTVTRADRAGILTALRIWRERDGMVGLPAGYGDARLLGNVYLHSVDSTLATPFARYVDDYRLFVRSVSEGEDCLAFLDIMLSKVGLALNQNKCSIVPADEYLRDGGRPLTSVFHPEVESWKQTSASLRDVFIRAVEGPRPNRRDLRFALPRLGKIRDDFAVSYCLTGILDMPWEAPRMVDYLSNFIDRRDVQDQVSDTAVQSIRAADDWMLARLAPILCRIPLGSHVSEALVDYLQTRPRSASSGLALRALASARHKATRALAFDCGIEARAVVAALLDMDVEVPASIRSSAPYTPCEHKYPLPSAMSQL